MHIPHLLLQAASAYIPFFQQREPSVLNDHTGLSSPHLDVTLIPVFDSAITSIKSLDIFIRIDTPATKGNATLVELPLSIGNVPSQQYNGSHAIFAQDDEGPLLLTIQDDHVRNVRIWLPHRDTEGDVVIACTAHPREVDMHTPIGPRVDLRSIDGGLLGAGIMMLPLPPQTDEECDIHLAWRYLNYPPGSRPRGLVAVSSLGWESEELLLTATLQTLQLSLFAVGTTLHRSPPFEQSRDFGIFYFGDEEDVPFAVPELARFVHDLHDKMDVFFQDPSPGSKHYRLFLRPSPRAFGGAAFEDAFMLEYFSTVNVTQTELRDVLAHEIVHNWPLMENSPNDTTLRADSTWYSEGVATYYQSLLPYRLNVTGREEFVAHLNRLMQAYYTNPAIGLTNVEAQEQAWSDPNAQRLPYHRGMLYLLILDRDLKRHSKDDVGVDELLLKLLNKRRAGERHDLHVWLDLVAAERDREMAVEGYERMANATFLIPAADALAYLKLTLIRHDQEQVQLGFATKSFNSRVIEGVVPGSRAQEAGVRDGDEIVACTMYWQVADDIGRNMWLRLKGDGVEREVEYWPRSREKVESYHWVDAHQPCVR